MQPWQLVRHFECGRCHDGTGHDSEFRHACVRCHAKLLSGKALTSLDVLPIEEAIPKGGRSMQSAFPEAVLRQMRANIKSFPAAPSFVALSKRLRRAWVASFLLAPHDLRPNLIGMMPRLAISAEQAEALAAYLVPHEDLSGPPPQSPALLDQGRRLINTMGCATCHHFTGLAEPLQMSPLPMPLSQEQRPEGITLAPDLRYTRQRFQPGALRAWLKVPKR